jgi:hypothetical protein
MRRGLIFSVENVSLTTYVLLYFGSVLFFATVYFYLPAGNGLTTNQGASPQEIGFGTAVYFSATTITTLCYGDVDPIGWARAFAALEGLVGLIFFGIMLTKATGARLSYHVYRLFASHAETRLDQFCSQAKKIESDLRVLLAQTATAFPETPGAIPTGQTEFLKSFAESVAHLHTFSVSFCQYLHTESDEGFFADSPQHTMIKASQDASLTIFVLKQIFITLSPQAKTVVLNETNWKRVTELLQHWETIGQKISKQSNNSELKTQFKAIGDMASSLSENFFSVPKDAKRQPDQEFRPQL